MFSSSYASTTTYSSPRRAKYASRPKTMQRSGSIFSAISKIVAAPLSWFASSDALEDLGKRQRVEPPESSDDEQIGSVRKRMRVESPLPQPQVEQQQQQVQYAGGYLDPPEASVRRSQSNVLPRPSYRSRVEANSTRSALARAPSFNAPRTMSMDPPTAQYATYNRDPSAIPLPLDSPMDISRNSVSIGPRDASMNPPTSPFRIRSSLTPQPSPSKPIRREASAPPPLSSLMSRPIFVKPPVEVDSSAKQLRAQKTMSLGSIAEYGRASRSPARELNLNGMASLQSAPSKLNMTSSSSSNIAGKTFRDLEMYKTPIIPSRYKDSKVIPEFLRQKKVHVPIPMSKKGRKAKPSLGMAAKEEVKEKSPEKGEGKPYAGKGNLSKMLARRRAEEEEERLEGLAEEEENNMSPGKRDVGVSARIVSESEDERHRNRSSRSIAEEDPFAKPARSYDRNQPYGRIGRTRTARLTTGTRSAQLSIRRLGNKFSAAFDEDDNMDDMSMEDQSIPDKGNVPQAKPIFDAPAGFSFSSGVQIQHDAGKAKEPPLSTLPFTFAKPTVPEPTKVSELLKKSVEQVAKPSTFSLEKSVERLPPSGNTGFVVPAAPVKGIPKVAIVPPTPEQSTTASEFFASPSPKKTEGSASAPSGTIPNFFANSSFLAGNKSGASGFLLTTTGQTPVSLPTAPLKDSANPLWDGDNAGKTPNPAALAGAERSLSSSSKPPPFGGFNRPSVLQDSKTSSTTSTTPSTIPNFFGTFASTQSKDLVAPSEEQRPSSAPTLGSAGASGSSTPNPTTPSFFGSSSGASSVSSTGFTPLLQPKSSEIVASPEAKAPSPSPSFFTFGAPQITASTSTPEPARPFSAPIISTSTSQTSAPPTTSPFAFGAPPSSSGSTTSEGPKLLGSSGFSFGQTTPAPAPVDTAKSPFSFGDPAATPATPPLAADSKPAFGGFSTNNGTGFTFGTPTKPTEVVSAAASSTPFTFGATSTRQVTPPNKIDEAMAMEESPTRMDLNGRVEGSNDKPALSLSFGNPQTSSFGQSSSSTSGFSFGSSSAMSNPFGSKSNGEDTKKSGFTFGSSAPAPPISTSFSFGQKSEGSSTPTTAFGTGPAGFPQSTTPSAVPTSTPFTFGSTAGANPFSAPAPAPAIQQTPSFTFGTPTTAPNNPFNFGSSQPASPATSVNGLPQSPATTNAPFTFGQPNGVGASAGMPAGNPFGPSASGGNLFNIGAAPPSTPRQIKKLPRRGTSVKR